MIIKSLDLNNFRNYKLQNIVFDEKVNILYGSNAQGKTNILEAIYMSGTNKSHRTTKDSEMIAFGEKEAHIKAIYEKRGSDQRIDMHLRTGKSKGIAINGVVLKKASQLYGLVNTVLFSPEDLALIKTGPSARRRFMDMELCQLDGVYTANLLNYNKTLDRRNRVLKDIGFNPSLEDTLDVWDAQLCKTGREIIKLRKAFIIRLNEIITGIHSSLTGGKEKLVISYEPSCESDDMESLLRSGRDKDIRNRLTSYGPHRDDIVFDIDGVDIRRFGSQGQQRTTALSLKLAEIELVRKLTNDNPILLLDDVLSELDKDRQNYLLGSIQNIQTIITCTGLDEFVGSRLNIDKVFEVNSGHVQEVRRQ